MPSVADGSVIADSYKEQGEKPDKELESLQEISLKFPLTPAPICDSDGGLALLEKSYSANSSKGKLVTNLRRGSFPSMKAAEEEGSAPQKTMAAAEAPRVGKPEVSHHRITRNSAYISEFAKKVRLRVKRVKRHVKPNVYQRRAAASDAKVKAFEAKRPSDDELCSTEVPDVAEETCDKTVDVELAMARNGSCQEGVCAELPHNGHTLGEEDLHIMQEGEPDMPDSTDVVIPKGRGGGDCMEDGEIDASQDADCYVVNGKSARVSAELVPQESALAANSSAPAQESGGNPSSREHIVAEPDVLCNSLPKGAFKEGMSKGPTEFSEAEGFSSGIRGKSLRDRELTPRELSRRDCREYATRSRGPSKARSMSVSVQDGGFVSETSKPDSKDHTVLDALLPDEPPGFSFGEGSDGGSDHGSGRRIGRMRKQRLEREAVSDHSQTDESETDLARSGAGTEDSGSEFSGSQERTVCMRQPVKAFSPGTPGRGAQLTDQVPSVLCDAEGNVWHIGKRAEQAKDFDGVQLPGPPKARFKERRSVALDHVRQYHELQESAVRELPPAGFTPFSHLVPLKWKGPLRPDDNLDLHSNRMVLAKERSIFVGCIPDGIENLEQLLNGLMDRFLERFDFAPVTFGQIEGVKAVKDFAFIELTSDKVAQIVLAANQLDVFEWGVDGFHFNIQGCTSTSTSVRPLIEYLPLKPARVLYVGNIPKSRWRVEYLEGFFSKMLRGSDGPTDIDYVVSVFLLPESCDAYVEVASEIMADSLIFKCTKTPEILKDVGEDVVICRDASSVPLMSRHTAFICPQRSLIVVVPPRAEYLKINAVVKVFVDLLPFIAKKSNCPGYLKYVRVEAGKDYAFFQFDSEEFVDAIMDEYIESTQIFLCRSPASYIILRPPDYVRPGATYRSGSHRLGTKYKLSTTHGYGKNVVGRKQARILSTDSIAYVPRKFGDEPVKKPDCIISVGATPVPLATWNGLSAAGACSTNPDCLITVQGLPRGLSFKLARGALNELFERLLCESGLLEVGMLVVSYLDRDGNFEVASLPNAEFVKALLSIDSVFVVAGEEIRLLPYEQQIGSFWKGNSADLSVGPCDLSSLSDEDSQGRMVVKHCATDEWSAPGVKQHRRRGHSELEVRMLPGYENVARGSYNQRKIVNDEWGEDDECWAGPFEGSQGSRGFSREMQPWHGVDDQPQSWDRLGGSQGTRSGSQGTTRPLEDLHCQGNNPRVRFPQSQKGTATYRNEPRSDDFGARFEKRSTEEGFRIVSREGRRTIQQVGSPYLHEAGGPVGMGSLSARKRKFPTAGLGGPVHTSGFNPKVRKSSQFFG